MHGCDGGAVAVAQSLSFAFLAYFGIVEKYMNVSSHFEKYGERYLVSSLCQLLQLLVFFSHEHALLAFSLSYVLIFLVLPCDTESFQQERCLLCCVFITEQLLCGFHMSFTLQEHRAEYQHL